MSIENVPDAYVETAAEHNRVLAQVNSLLARVIPFDDWVMRRNPSGRDKALYLVVVAGLERERKNLIILGAKAAEPWPS